MFFFVLFHVKRSKASLSEGGGTAIAVTEGVITSYEFRVMRLPAAIVMRTPAGLFKSPRLPCGQPAPFTRGPSSYPTSNGIRRGRCPHRPGRIWNPPLHRYPTSNRIRRGGVSLRLGPPAALTVHRTVIHFRGMSLRYSVPSRKGDATAWVYLPPREWFYHFPTVAARNTEKTRKNP